MQAIQRTIDSTQSPKWHYTLIVKRAGFPATGEPHRLLRIDGKNPDGFALTRREGRCLVLEVIVADTTVASYLEANKTVVGNGAEFAVVRKK